MNRKPTPRDNLFSQNQPDLVDFAFDERVAAVFPDMIRRSVPGYTELVANLGLFAARYAQADSNLYDLGCSLGAATLSMRTRVQAPGCRIIAVDSSAAMLEQARASLSATSPEGTEQTPVELVQGDIRDIPLQSASLVVLNFTLQFLPPEDRETLLARIADALLPGGALVLAEKLAFDEPGERELFEALYADFKRANGYSELEIAQKRAALERVMIPDSANTHQERLQRAGFSQVHSWFRCLNFAAWLGVK